VKMKGLSPVGTAPVLPPKQIARNFIVRMVTSMIVLVTVIAAQKVGLEMVLLIVVIKPMDATEPVMIVMVVTALSLHIQ